jgi:DNA-directed RNA polymerase specialized sigma24 family protein
MPPEMAERRAQRERMMSMPSGQRWEERRAELNQRYSELRKRAAETGVPLPEMPPWEQSPGPGGFGDQAAPPASAAMPEPPAAFGPGIGHPMPDEAWEAMHEMMMSMTPEEREAMRDKHYQEMRERAKARGIEMPETPPWKRAQPTQPPTPSPQEQQWAKLKEVINAMSPEQREACMAMQRLRAPMPPRLPMAYPGRGWGNVPDQGWGSGPDQDWWAAPDQGWGRGGAPGYGPYAPRLPQQWPGYGE